MEIAGHVTVQSLKALVSGVAVYCIRDGCVAEAIVLQTVQVSAVASSLWGHLRTPEMWIRADRNASTHKCHLRPVALLHSLTIEYAV